ncbi:hypothetical protein RM553_12660 [Zunongwangia sp. F363]|uniref:DUF4468 domain-containing protein n=1 Tax=Autumnicola tepida TaxID=3075595 RepID=A0ABU3CBG7_9FLAO|nr:hypothetical protein [Zunongwangia sp. F363]MDT0643686.1 hypothetical protein [Zunongwangia sp. F363]
MKKLFTLLFVFISFSSFSQEENRFAQAAKEAAEIAEQQPEVIAFEKRLQEDLAEIREISEDPEYIEIKVTASVLEIFNGSALVVSSDYAKHFKVNTAALQKGWEYFFRLRVNASDKKLKHCSGCTGILDAEIIGYSISPGQAKRNILQISEDQGEGYSRSPRYN